MSRGLGSGQGDSGGASGLLELWGSREDGGRIGQRLDKRFDLMIVQCYENIFEVIDTYLLIL